MYFSIPLFFYFRAIYIKIYTSLFIFFRNSGKLLFVPYTKDFGRITQFWGNDLATVLYATFCSDMLSSHSFSKQR